MGDTMSQHSTSQENTKQAADNASGGAQTGADKHREALSALLDGEVTELEARRLLRDMTDEDGDCLASWQLASDLMRGHQAASVPKDFNANLMAALANERKGRPAWMHPVASLAVAASVAVATVIGWQYWEYSSALEQPAMVSNDSRLPRLLGGDTELVSQSLRPQALPAAVQAEQARREAMLEQRSELVARHRDQDVILSARIDSEEEALADQHAEATPVGDVTDLTPNAATRED